MAPSGLRRLLLPALPALTALAIGASPAAASSSMSSSAGPAERGSSMRGAAAAQALASELSAAMEEALGCGGHVDEAHLLQLEGKLLPMWRTLAHDEAGTVDRRSLRYVVHRHFNRESALHIRGFEPSRPANVSGWGSEDILSQRVPAFVETFLESRHKLESGFTLRDAATMVAALEQLIFDFEGAILERVYFEQVKPLERSLSRQGLEQVLEAYVVHWMLGDDEESIEALFSDRSLLASAIPHWNELVGFLHGEISSLDHRRRAAPREAPSRPGHNALAQKYSFEDAHGVVGDITKKFASYWESECSAMKAQLVDMDTHGTGRVPLAKFYGTGLDADWRFGESENYLRELGALDETSWRGKQVIIPNYIQAASNCIISTKHYRVCCINDCEVLLDDLEAAIGAPTAGAAQILAVVGNLSSHSSVDDDQPPALEGELTTQLEAIAEAHGGLVPLHGRLFAQWLHYAYPRECPFPHKAGAAAVVSPTEFGELYAASSEEMERLASEGVSDEAPANASREELQWMSQWSPEEELITEPAALGLRAPWERSRGAAKLLLVLALAAAALLGAAHHGGGSRDGGGVGSLLTGLLGGGAAGGKGSGGLLPYHSKAHFV